MDIKAEYFEPLSSGLTTSRFGKHTRLIPAIDGDDKVAVLSMLTNLTSELLKSYYNYDSMREYMNILPKFGKHLTYNIKGTEGYDSTYKESEFLMCMLSRGTIAIHTTLMNDMWVVVLGYHGKGDLMRDTVIFYDTISDDIRTMTADEFLTSWSNMEYIIGEMQR